MPCCEPRALTTTPHKCTLAISSYDPVRPTNHKDGVRREVRLRGVVFERRRASNRSEGGKRIFRTVAVSVGLRPDRRRSFHYLLLLSALATLMECSAASNFLVMQPTGYMTRRLRFDLLFLRLLCGNGRKRSPLGSGGALLLSHASRGFFPPSASSKFPAFGTLLSKEIQCFRRQLRSGHALSYMGS